MEGSEAVSMIQHYIINEALILIPVLWVIGYLIKQTPRIPDWAIVWILTIAGVVGGITIIGANSDGVIQGILVAGASVLGHQLMLQTKKK